MQAWLSPQPNPVAQCSNVQPFPWLQQKGTDFFESKERATTNESILKDRQHNAIHTTSIVGHLHVFDKHIHESCISRRKESRQGRP